VFTLVVLEIQLNLSEWKVLQVPGNLCLQKERVGDSVLRVGVFLLLSYSLLGQMKKLY